jgi:hypothetical protein
MQRFYFIRKGKCRVYGLIIILLLFTGPLSAQLKWDGEAGDGQWTSAANWVGDALPAGGDNVLLDNGVVTSNYVVTLPGGTSAVTIKTIAISPSTGKNIQLILPASNTALVPAFVTSGPGYGIVINDGGIFQNSSGTTSGNAISVTDSFRINNGGQYIHNTRSAHVALVTVLSKSPGTETGIFKFDVPGGSYTFSTANRVYGIVIFSSAASGGTQFYNAIAASPLTVNSDIVINPGVTVNLDINNNVLIKRDFIQNGGIFNIASQPNSNTTYIRRNLVQTSGTITETSTGLPVIELDGTSNQDITIGGIISNSVIIKINNPVGVTLLGNASLPYRLDLINGIVTTSSFLLTLLNGCTIVADSTTNRSFINGRLRKEGLSSASHFLFPVGKDITQRWLGLKNVTGNYTVEFFKGNPNLISNNIGPGIHHTSSIEYWTVEADAIPMPTGGVELSFDNINSGGVTDLPSLRVAQLNNNIWQDAGNTGTTGIVGFGSVISNPLNFSAVNATRYFTLSSSNALQNPLPLKDMYFAANKTNDGVEIKWKTETSFSPAFFELQSSEDGISFLTLTTIKRVMHPHHYRYADKRKINNQRLYRLQITKPDGSFFYSRVIAVTTDNNKNLQLIPSVINSTSTLLMNTTGETSMQIKINDIQGRMLQTIHLQVVAGVNRIPLQLNNLSAGVYWLSVITGKNKIACIRFVKL